MISSGAGGDVGAVLVEAASIGYLVGLLATRAERSARVDPIHTTCCADTGRGQTQPGASAALIFKGSIAKATSTAGWLADAWDGYDGGRAAVRHPVDLQRLQPRPAVVPPGRSARSRECG
ncbi:hypothetical protein ABZ914_03680 [Spirillospora sp. NPDC046719]